MIKLNYQTDNPRWGWSGIKYSSWDNYAFALGYLSNINHYRNSRGNGAALIEVHFEGNDLQGAWGKEGRIHYYGKKSFLQQYFPDWFNCSSAGVGEVTFRMNSNDFIHSLIYDYDFEIKEYAGYTTRDIFPPDDVENVANILVNAVPLNVDKNNVLDAFSAGFDL